MRTRPSTSATFLEERDKKRPERKERELRESLTAAGVDRPDINAFGNSPVKTRSQSNERTPSRSVEVVIYCPTVGTGARQFLEISSVTPDLKNSSQKTNLAGPEPTEVIYQGQEQDRGVLTGDHPICDPVISEIGRGKGRHFISKSFLARGGDPGGRKKRIPLKDLQKAISRQIPGAGRKRVSLKDLQQVVKSQSKRRTSRYMVLKRLKELYLKPLEPVLQSLPLLKQLSRSEVPELRHAIKSTRTSLQLKPRSGQLIAHLLSQNSYLTSEREASGELSTSNTSPGLPMPSKIANIGTQSSSVNGAASQDHETSLTERQEPEVAESPVFPLTEECKHYTNISQVDWDIQKYWHQRNSIFSRYNEGIRMTYDAWFGVTPEPVANKVSDDFAGFCDPSKTVVVDMFAGAGGNTIAFALSGRWSKVIGIEKDPSVIACAQHNAGIYGVADQITWINDDSFSYLTSPSSSIDVSKTVIFASPPWGGPGYRSDEVFNLNTMQPYSIKQIHRICKDMDSALYLPRTSDLKQIARLAPEGKKVEVVQYCMEGASKALVAYIPAAAPVISS